MKGVPDEKFFLTPLFIGIIRGVFVNRIYLQWVAVINNEVKNGATREPKLI